MKIEFDPAKSAKNERERGLPFELVVQVDWVGSYTEEDVRFAYPERRWVTYGLLGGRLHVICHVPFAEDGTRVISFRKANRREIRKYEEKKAAH
jgi:uncharacterized DUF497 family protein